MTEPLKGELKPDELACGECDSPVAVDHREILSEYAGRVHYSCDEGHVGMQVIRSPRGEGGVEHELRRLRRTRSVESFSPVFHRGIEL